MNNQIRQIMQRTMRYYYDDGLVEITLGLLFTLISLAVLAMLFAPLGPAYAIGISFGLMVLIFVGVFAVRWLVATLKERITYERTGYVQYKNETTKVGRWLMLLPTVFVVITALFLPEWMNAMSVMEGALLFLVFFYMGVRVHMRRMIGLAILNLIVGIAAAWQRLGDVQGTAAVFVACGLALLLTGSWTLRAYLKGNPLTEEPA